MQRTLGHSCDILVLDVVHVTFRNLDVDRRQGIPTMREEGGCAYRKRAARTEASPPREKGNPNQTNPERRYCLRGIVALQKQLCLTKQQLLRVEVAVKKLVFER